MVVAAVGSIETQLRLQRATEKLYGAYRYSNILLDNMSNDLISVNNADNVLREVRGRDVVLSRE